MLPAKQKKIDMSKMTDEERTAFRKYGKLPHRAGLTNKFQERKYFDSGDYALQKAGKISAPVGVQHPSPDKIPHAASNKIPHAASNNPTQPQQPNKAAVQRESHLTHDATREISEEDQTPTVSKTQHNSA